MQQDHLRTLAGVALSALVIGTTAPRLVHAQPTPAPQPQPTAASNGNVPQPSGTFNPNASVTLPPASQPTSMPYPAYGTPAPGVNAGLPNPGVPQVITLDEATAIGFAQSPLLAQARAQLQIASAPVQLARTALLPSISGSVSSRRLHSQDGSGSSTTSGGTTGTGNTVTGGTTTGTGGTTTGTGGTTTGTGGTTTGTGGTTTGTGGTTTGTGGTTTGTGGTTTTTTTTGTGGAAPISYTSNELAVTLSQLIYDGGHIAAELREAKYNQSAQAATYKRTLQTVAYNIANAYYTHLAAQRATAVAVQTVLVDQTNENLVSAQIRAGSAARADLATAQLPTAQARLAVVRDQGTELSAQATFANAMGLDANTLVLPRDDTPVNGAQVKSIVEIPTYAQAIARALVLRPDVLAAQYAVAGYRSAVRVAALSNFPSLAADASAATGSTDLTGGAYRNNSSFGLTLTLPIYDQGVVAAEVAQARGNLALGVANQTVTTQAVQLNVKQTLVALVSARAALGSADAELNQAQVVLKSTQAQYRAGVTTLPLLLNAQVGLTQALTDQSTAVYNLRLSEQAFLYAEGANGAP